MTHWRRYEQLRFLLITSFIFVALATHAQFPQLEWAKGMGGSSLSTSGTSVKIDASGNVYTTGQFSGTTDFDPGSGTANLTSAGGSDIYVSKLDANGNFVWARRIGSTGTDFGNEISIDGSGNVYVTGRFEATVDFDPGAGTSTQTSAGLSDIFILKLDAAGVYQWAVKIGGTAADEGNGLTIDPSGDILITGEFTGTVDFDPSASTTNLVSLGGLDIFVAKFSNAGNFIWAKSVGGSSADVGNAIATDISGNVFATGTFIGTVDFDPDAGTTNLTSTSGTFILKLTNAGSFSFARAFTGTSAVEAKSIAVDGSGNIFTTGEFGGTVDFDPGAGTFNQTEGGSGDIFISKLNASGNFLWAAGIGNNQEDGGRSITVDASGNSYLTGHFAATVDFDPGSGVFNLSSTPANSYDIFISKFDPAGNLVWAVKMGGNDDFEIGESIVVDGSSNVYVTGQFSGVADFDPGAGAFNLTGAGTSENAFIVKLNPQNFITQWNLATAGSGATQLSFGTATSGTVNYFWQQLPSGATGSGSWSGATLTITGLPTGATIRLQIAPTNFQRIIINTGTDRNRLTRVEQWGSTAWTSMQNAFRGCANLQVTATDVPTLSGVSDLSGMFSLCTNLNSPSNIGSWNTSVVTNMSSMFNQAFAFNQNISSWNTSAVTNMSNLFASAAAFNQDIGVWNTAAVTNMNSMFSGATAFNRNIGAWNTAAVTDMAVMFYSAYVFNQNISGWNTAAVTNMSSMFGYAYDFNQNIGTWNTSAVTNMSRMFEDAFDFNQNIGTWNTSAVTNMNGMFIDAYAFNQNIGTWNTAAVTNMQRMFDFATAFNQNIGAWNTSAVTNMGGMFADASAFNQNLGSWTLNPAVSLAGMLNNSGLNCNNYSATLIGWSANTSTPNGRTLAANGRQYGTNAVAARTNLISTKGWTITGDTPSGSACSFVPPPTITSFTPSSGPIGTTVTITGTNFNTTAANNIVYFGATRAVVSASTATQLTVILTAGATYQPISVITNGLNAFSSKPFAITFADGGIIDACSFATKVDLTAGINPSSVAIGDIDNDGKPDLVIANEAENTFSIFKNISSTGTIDASSFAAKVEFVTGNGPRGIFIKDLDGDGKPEIGVANKNSNTISIFRNTGFTGIINTSSFAPRVNFTTATAPHDIAIHDFDGDGKPDLAVTNNFSTSVSVIKNTSTTGSITTGSFAAKVDFTTGFGPQGIASRDIDDDGKPDLVITNEGASSISILKNTASVGTITVSSFAAKVDFAVGPNPTNVAIADLDGDGKPDVAVSNADNGTVSVLRNISTTSVIDAGSFSTNVDFFSGGGYAIEIDDMNGDGKPDLVTNSNSNKIAVLRNLSSLGTINSSSFAFPVEFAIAEDIEGGLALGDFDGNGKPDIVAAGGSDQASILRNTVSGLPAFTSSGFSPTSGTVGTTVTITGTNFSTTILNNTVKFNGTPAVVTASTSTSITTSVPAGATTGSISLEIGCVQAFSIFPFTVIASTPTISSFTPSSGQVGTTVIITGTNFSATPDDNVVAFNGIPAEVLASTTTSITTFVPSGASTGTITVTVGSITATSSSAFTVTTSSANWLRQLSSAGGYVGGNAIVIDGSENNYTSGSFTGTVDFDPGAGVFNLTAQATDIFVVKLDASGNFVWAKSMGGANDDIGQSIRVDGSGNVYVAGIFSGTADFDPGVGTFNITAVGSRDIFISKLDANGNFVWAKSISGSGFKELNSIALDATGNVFATGYFSGTADFDPGAPTVNLTSAGGFDIFIVKLDNGGNYIWSGRMGSTGTDVGQGITTDASGNAILTGYFEGTVDFDPGAGTTSLASTGDHDVFVVKSNSSGGFIWAKNVGSSSSDYGYALTTDVSGSVYVTGFFSTTGDFDPGVGEYILDPGTENEDAFIFKLLSDGSFSWATKFGGPHGGTSPFSIGVDGSGNAYVIGETFDGIDFDEILMAGFDSNGNKVFQDITNIEGRGTSLAVSSFGNIYATGEFDGTVEFSLGDCLGTLNSVSGDAFILKTRANSFPVPTITSFSPTSGGEGTTVIITGVNFSTIPASNIVYFEGDPAIVTASTATTITTSVPVGAVTGRIYVSSGCRTAASTIDFTIDPTINITTQPSTSITACGGQVITFTTIASGTSGITYQWQKLNTATSVYEDVSNTGGYSGASASSLTINTSGNFGAGDYRCKVSGDFVANVFSNTASVTINTTPPAPTVTDAALCSAGSASLIAAGANNGQYRWYIVATGGTALAGEVNNTYTIPTLSVTTSYYVSINNGTCESSRTVVTATINPTPAAPSTTGGTGCTSTTVTLSATGSTAGQYRWYTTATGGVAIAGQVNNTFITPVLTATTIYYVAINNGTCESSRTLVTATIQVCNQPPTIASTNVQAPVDGSVTVPLTALLSDPDNNLDLSTLQVVVQPLSGALASIDAQHNLILDYKGISFSGTEKLTIEVCDLLAACSQKEISIEVIGATIVFNAVSPNNDGKNDFFYIQYIDALEETKKNRVSIYNRWGDMIIEITDYDNKTKVFNGLNTHGNEVPSGIYFYKIEFESGLDAKTGYLTLKR